MFELAVLLLTTASSLVGLWHKLARGSLWDLVVKHHTIVASLITMTGFMVSIFAFAREVNRFALAMTLEADLGESVLLFTSTLGRVFQWTLAALGLSLVVSLSAKWAASRQPGSEDDEH